MNGTAPTHVEQVFPRALGRRGILVRYVVGSVRMYGASTRLDAILAFAGMSFGR